MCIQINTQEPTPTTQPTPPTQPTPEPVTDSQADNDIQILQSQLEDALRGQTKLSHGLHSLQQKHKEENHQHRHTLEQLQKRVEAYRRIDFIHKKEIELVQDKLQTMGRQYYQAVSEVAALKGTVPPPPKV